MSILKKKIEVADSGVRLDYFLSVNFVNYSRSAWTQMIKDGNVLVNGEKMRPSFKLKEGNDILINLTPPKADIEKNVDKFKLDIIYEDHGVIVINKPAGLVVHPGSGGYYKETLVDVIYEERKEIFDIFGEDRPGIVHRLDKETSGVMVLAKTTEAFKKVTAQISNRKIKKEYLAIVCGLLENKTGSINVPIKRQIVDRKKMGVSSLGRKSVTEYTVKEEFSKFSLVKAIPLTGRTHQIRVHMAFIGNPIVGDKFYSSRIKQKEAVEMEVTRHMLHALSLGFKNPSTGEFQEFIAPLPKDFTDTLFLLRGL